MLNIEVLYRCALSSFVLKTGNHHFEIHVIDIRYWIFQSPSRGLLEPTRSAGGGSVIGRSFRAPAEGNCFAAASPHGETARFPMGKQIDENLFDID
jgi:hypothetical protein